MGSGETRRGRIRRIWTTLWSNFFSKGNRWWLEWDVRSKEVFIVVIFVCFVFRRELFAANVLADGNDSVESEKPMTQKRKGSTTGVMCFFGARPGSQGPSGEPGTSFGDLKGADTRSHLGKVGRCGGGRSSRWGKSLPVSSGERKPGY